MRWTKVFIPTLREDPADAEIPSHRLMVRAGLLRRVGSGAYSYLPLGWRSLNKAIMIVREEMDRAGALEVLLPAIHPAELWKRTGRYDVLLDILMRFQDRQGREIVLGPTHEEVITELVAREVRSYKELPITLYQIQAKFRDEPRPRFGVLRSREFIMKDAYSFDTDIDGLNRSYEAMYDAYCRIFERCGLDYIAVEAESGAMGGDVSHEFMVPTDAGEDTLVVCGKCGYSANRERAEIGELPHSTEEPLPLQEVDTPAMTTIEQVSSFLNVKPKRLAKTLIYQTPDGVVAVMIRGDHEVNETKLRRMLGCELSLADEEKVVEASGCSVGFAGPVGLSVRIVADRAVALARNLVTGANKDDKHIINVNPGRDFDIELVADVRFAVDGDPCPRCSGRLRLRKGIEVGHVFKLGTKYSEALNATFLDENGAEHPIIMGCYGIGVNRILAARIEINHDEKGIIWHPSIAPYETDVLLVSPDDSEVAETAEKAYRELIDSGIDAIIDDRRESPGVKFNDADLIGFPLRVTVGKKALQKGGVELKLRDRKDTEIVPLGGVAVRARELLNSIC